MSQHAAFHDAMPAMRAHEGCWTGQYIHLDTNAVELERHDSHVTCEFPDDGPFAYIQHNIFTHADGRIDKARLDGTFRDGRLWWDTPTFSGSAWETKDGVILLHLDRKDLVGVKFWEIILPPVNNIRSRTWHFVKEGALIRRTLCEERRI
ncbi:hypothetical protein ACFFUB_14360 [Algimonas porphyrae]|nr:hypothetical protein [Algimonas porphyrae]